MDAEVEEEGGVMDGKGDKAGGAGGAAGAGVRGELATLARGGVARVGGTRGRKGGSEGGSEGGGEGGMDHEYYTREEVREVIEHAAVMGVTVMPEVR
jgi:hypothetical protein